MLKSISIILLSFVCNWLYANEEQALNLLTAKIENYVNNALSSSPAQKVQAVVTPIDSRLKLSQCAESNLDVFNPYQKALKGTVTLGIQCQENDNHWTLYVPVKIKILQPVIAAVHPLARGTIITAADLVSQEQDVSQVTQAYFTSSEEIIGKACSKPIAAGRIITPLDIQKPVAIYRGEQITIQVVYDSFKVSSEGIALENGATGDFIKVKNLASKKIVQGQIVAAKQVAITI